jgi:hypothetical protein
VSPYTLTEWLVRDTGPPPRARDRIDLEGLARLPRLLGEVLAARPEMGRSQDWGRGKKGRVRDTFLQQSSVSPSSEEIEYADL